ncbi:hypothetical protein GGI24_003004 [Coemansia furcata]|nr:hypothetical protein GGI24_003004 [Coemansia furcata]
MFPNLSTLEVTGSYPFTDDLLFRGNGATLQTLYLPFKTIADNTLGELGILERKGVTKMKKIRFGNVTERDKIIIKGNGRERISQQLDRILEVATGLWLSSDGRKYEVYLSMIRTTCVANVRYLDFCKLTFRHDHVIRTIRALPNLVSFTVAITHISEHGPISDYIKKASDLYKRNSGDDIAKEAIRIAIVCKNPVQFHVPPHEHHRFKHTVSRAIASDEFAPYADSLRHLL